MNWSQPDIYDLGYRVAELEEMVRKLERVHEFNLQSVPIKYRKAFPSEHEDPFFRIRCITPKAFPLNESGIDPPIERIDVPDDPLIIQAAKERMREYAKIAAEKQRAAKKYRKARKKKSPVKPET